MRGWRATPPSSAFQKRESLLNLQITKSVYFSLRSTWNHESSCERETSWDCDGQTSQAHPILRQWVAKTQCHKPQKSHIGETVIRNSPVIVITTANE
eukprot:scaffold225046_cov56-Cyclotella_meneghiniana.AAC.1